MKQWITPPTVPAASAPRMRGGLGVRLAHVHHERAPERAREPDRARERRLLRRTRRVVVVVVEARLADGDDAGRGGEAR